ncbi:predicted protein, partial [Nematostella vectensis]
LNKLCSFTHCAPLIMSALLDSNLLCTPYNLYLLIDSHLLCTPYNVSCTFSLTLISCAPPIMYAVPSH